MRLTPVRLAVFAAAALSSQAAFADVASMRAEIHGGVGRGHGLAGDLKDDAFSVDSPLGMYGALVGVEVLFIDVFVEHHQHTDGDRLTTWTQFATGFDIDFGFGGSEAVGKSEAKPAGYAELGLYTGFGVGTGQQVDPPLDNSEVTDKGFLVDGRLSVGWFLGRRIRLGVTVPVSYGYFFKSGAANDVSNHYQSIQAAALATLRFDIKLK